MSTAAQQTRTNRTITVDFRDDATYAQLLGDGKAFVEFVCAFLLALGFQLAHKATCQGGGCLTRHSHYLRARLGGVTIWRIQCTRCRAVINHISPMALYRVVCALGQHSLVTVLVKCRLPLPAYILADEKHSYCLTERVYLPTIVSGRVIWHLGYSDAKSAAAFTASYGQFQQAALEHDASYRVQGALTDGFDSTVSSMRTLFPGARLGYCLRHALNKLPDKLIGLSAPVRQGLRAQFHTLLHRCRQRKSLRVVALGQRLRHFADHIATTVGPAHGERVRSWCEAKKAGWYAVLGDPQMPAMSTVLDQAHNAIDRKLFAMKGFHHPSGSQTALLTGLAHLYNLVPYQRRALNAGKCGVGVEGGRVPTSDWMLNLQILTSGGYRPTGMGATT